jgi:hypothetical protein
MSFHLIPNKPGKEWRANMLGVVVAGLAGFGAMVTFILVVFSGALGG